MAEEIKTFLDIQNAIMRRAKLEDNSTVRADIKEKINTSYQDILFKKSYKWSGANVPFVLKGKYATGTVSVTQGSDTITGSGTAWDETAHLFSKIKVGSVNNPYKIIRVASATSIVMDAPYTDTSTSGLAYTIFKDEYGLPPDLMNIRKLLPPNFAGKRASLPCSPEDMDNKRRQFPFRVGIPEFYTINGQNYYNSKTWGTFNIGTDFWEDPFFTNPPRNDNLIVWPGILDTDTIVQIRYSVIPTPMSGDTEEPLIPYYNRAILVYYPLVQYFGQNRDFQTRGIWVSERDALLKKMQSDIETVNDELILMIDRSSNRRRTSALFSTGDRNVDI